MELDSLLTILAAVALVLLQIVSAANKRKKSIDQGKRTGLERSVTDFSERRDDGEADAESESEAEWMVRVDEEGEHFAKFFETREVTPNAKAILKPESLYKTDDKIPENAEISNDEEELLLSDFTAQKAILYSEVINPRWNSPLYN